MVNSHIRNFPLKIRNMPRAGRYGNFPKNSDNPVLRTPEIIQDVSHKTLCFGSNNGFFHGLEFLKLRTQYRL